MCQCAICCFSFTPFTMSESHLVFLHCPGSLIPSCAPQLCFHGAGTCCLHRVHVPLIAVLYMWASPRAVEWELCIFCGVQDYWWESPLCRLCFSQRTGCLICWVPLHSSLLELECHVPVLSVHGQSQQFTGHTGCSCLQEMLLWSGEGHICMRQLVFSHLMRVQVTMAKMQAFPMSAHVPLLLCLLVRKVVRRGGLWPVEQVSCGSPCPCAAGEAGRDSHWLWVTGGCAVLFSGIARMGADSSQNPTGAGGAIPNTLCWHGTGMNNISERSIPGTF